MSNLYFIKYNHLNSKFWIIYIKVTNDRRWYTCHVSVVVQSVAVLQNAVVQANAVALATVVTAVVDIIMVVTVVIADLVDMVMGLDVDMVHGG